MGWMHILMTPYVAEVKVSLVWLKIFYPFSFLSPSFRVFCVFYYRWNLLAFLMCLLQHTLSCSLSRWTVCTMHINVYGKTFTYCLYQTILSGSCVYEHVHCICELLVYRSSNFHATIFESKQKKRAIDRSISFPSRLSCTFRHMHTYNIRI